MKGTQGLLLSVRARIHIRDLLRVLTFALFCPLPVAPFCGEPQGRRWTNRRLGREGQAKVLPRQGVGVFIRGFLGSHGRINEQGTLLIRCLFLSDLVLLCRIRQSRGKGQGNGSCLMPCPGEELRGVDLGGEGKNGEQRVQGYPGGGTARRWLARAVTGRGGQNPG